MKKFIFLISIAILLIAFLLGFFWILPNDCPPPQLVTATLTYSNNGTTATTTAVNQITCVPVPTSLFGAYPAEFFIAIIVGLITAFTKVCRS